MKVLMTGIYSRAIATSGTPPVHNSFYISIGGRFYFEMAPQDATLPFCTYHIISNSYDYTFSDNFEDFLIQFSIFSETSSSSEIMDIFENLKTLFDWCDSSLSVTGYSVSRFERIFADTSWIAEESCWAQTVQYRIVLKKN